MRSNWFPVILGIILALVIVSGVIEEFEQHKRVDTIFAEYLLRETNDSTWVAPSLYADQELGGKNRSMVIYGQDLIAHTSVYFGPNGSVSKTSNGMNCQNCHLDAGTRAWGNNFGAVYSNYPKLRGRSNSIENIFKRINDCFERSLNGNAVDTNSYEMQAMYAYLKWLGKDVPKGKTPYSSGLTDLPFLDRAADAGKGEHVFKNICQACHGDSGQGILNPRGNEYIYPPLWGRYSYNDGAGLYRLSNFATYVKNNMPYNQATHEHPKLTNEEAWDVAAFVNSRPRPHFDQSYDYPVLTKKPFDAPFGPYADNFTATQHKYGPYLPIINAGKNKKFNSSKTN